MAKRVTREYLEKASLKQLRQYLQSLDLQVFDNETVHELRDTAIEALEQTLPMAHRA